MGEKIISFVWHDVHAMERMRIHGDDFILICGANCVYGNADKNVWEEVDDHIYREIQAPASEFIRELYSSIEKLRKMRRNADHTIFLILPNCFREEDQIFQSGVLVVVSILGIGSHPEHGKFEILDGSMQNPIEMNVRDYTDAESAIESFEILRVLQS